MKNPNDPELLDEGVRSKIVINDENFYMYISDKAVTCTVPRENDPQMSSVRKIVEQLCDYITENLGGK